MAAVITRPQLVTESPVNRDHSVTKAISSLYVAKTPEDLWSSFREAGWGMPQTCCYSSCIHLHNLQSFNPLSSSECSFPEKCSCHCDMHAIFLGGSGYGECDNRCFLFEKAAES